MLDLEDIEILPESMPPPATDSTPVWMVVVALAIILVIAAFIVRALVSNPKKSPASTNPLDRARNELLRISQSLTNPGVAESFPTIIHAWANDQLEHRSALPEKTVADITSARDLVAPHCYLPATRWRNDIQPESILASLASSLEIDITNDRKGGLTNDA